MTRQGKILRCLDALKAFKVPGSDSYQVSHSAGEIDKVIYFQDCIGRMDFEEIREMWEGFADQQQRDNFYFVLFHTLDPQAALDIIKKTAINALVNRELDNIQEDYQEYYNQVNAERAALAENRKHIYKRIAKLEKRAQLAEERMIRYRESDNRQHRLLLKERHKTAVIRDQAKRYEKIKELLNPDY